MMTFIINLLALLGAFLATEGAAWLLHRYVMHGALWMLHESHHQKVEGQFFEKNDLFFLFFAIPGAWLIYLGIAQGWNYWFYAGLGITLYGVVYFWVHDVFIHQRYAFFRKSRNRYLRALRRAHHAHHKHTQREGGESFGLLWVAKQYYEK
ncbi:MAG: sterol desaturase family protein [Bernardetiaceae bacterium]|jgi:beta-carotene 3-hydroxylase|nr:sterol desaturase family protein [Bernardetiaceae bacterium]